MIHRSYLITLVITTLSSSTLVFSTILYCPMFLPYAQDRRCEIHGGGVSD